MDHVLASGVSQDIIVAAGVGTKSPLMEEKIEDDRRFNRAVSFEVLQ